jgi:hypothetical protein
LPSRPASPTAGPAVKPPERSWLLLGGTGKYRHAFGFGQFKFFEVAKLARHKDGSCDTNPNDQPVSFFGKVTAWGKATAG